MQANEVLTPEHKAKIAAGRDAYFAKRRAEKAAFSALNKTNPVVPEFDLENTFNGPVKNPPSPLRGEKKLNLSPREKTQHRVNKKLDKLLDAQIDAATGLYYVTADGKHVYKQKPETDTGQYLLNQLIGKPKESIEIKSTNINLDV